MIDVKGPEGPPRNKNLQKKDRRERIEAEKAQSKPHNATPKNKEDHLTLSIFIAKLARVFRGTYHGNPVVPERSDASQTLLIVVAIMSFLTCLTFASVSLVWQQASTWQQDISSEVTIQIRPVSGANLEEEVEKARNLAERTPGILNVSLLDDAWSAQLLEPWLGEGFDIDELPLPRILVLELDQNRPTNLSGLASRIEANVKGASFDDHRLWLDHLKSMARTTVFVGLCLMGLMLTAMVLSITFATQGAMTGNHEVVEVLHFVGGRDEFIANEFQRRFLSLGFKGGLIGGVGAIACFLCLRLWSVFSGKTPQSDQLEALFGRFEIGITGYSGMIGLILLVAVLTAATSRLAVFRYLTKMP